MPSALRPSHVINLNACGLNGAVVFMSIKPDGRVIPINANGHNVSLDAISFAARE